MLFFTHSPEMEQTVPLAYSRFTLQANVGSAQSALLIEMSSTPHTLSSLTIHQVRC